MIANSFTEFASHVTEDDIGVDAHETLLMPTLCRCPVILTEGSFKRLQTTIARAVKGDRRLVYLDLIAANDDVWVVECQRFSDRTVYTMWVRIRAGHHPRKPR